MGWGGKGRGGWGGERGGGFPSRLQGREEGRKKGEIEEVLSDVAVTEKYRYFNTQGGKYYYSRIFLFSK